jgi:hypothetical protein
MSRREAVLLATVEIEREMHREAVERAVGVDMERKRRWRMALAQEGGGGLHLMRGAMGSEGERPSQVYGGALWASVMGCVSAPMPN